MEIIYVEPIAQSSLYTSYADLFQRLNTQEERDLPTAWGQDEKCENTFFYFYMTEPTVPN